ncbi:hypothetical protein [Saccharopolyspora sp. NPDC049426]|uniref:hypothetical protein n=1 Tax=Saccharopolyspora sp. NPDC049426 TaxID=3155652 RepID=UPI00342A66C0
MTTWVLVPALDERHRVTRAQVIGVRRFGADYERYRREVPAWIPRSRPWYP